MISDELWPVAERLHQEKVEREEARERQQEADITVQIGLLEVKVRELEERATLSCARLLAAQVALCRMADALKDMITIVNGRVEALEKMPCPVEVAREQAEAMEGLPTPDRG